MRTFETGATRDDDANKIDYLGHMSHLAVERFCRYMHEHRVQPDGQLRAADNYKHGIPIASYMASGYRHMQDLAKHWEATGQVNEDLACATWFNIMGLLHEVMKARDNQTVTGFVGPVTSDTEILKPNPALTSPEITAASHPELFPVGTKVKVNGLESQIVMEADEFTKPRQIRVGDWPHGGYPINARRSTVTLWPRCGDQSPDYPGDNEYACPLDEGHELPHVCGCGCETRWGADGRPSIQGDK